jgi:chromatin segregation and condensation protein Rec8/ScpA/Scc1 (kleisin family)
MKSKLLLPDLTVDEMEEGPDLETQLRTYKAFVEASRAIDALWKSGQRSFPRSKPMVVKAEQGFRPPENFFPGGLFIIFRIYTLSHWF